MKASLKFREDQKPLVRAKIPISILGLPFLSGISAGDSKELRLDLLTAFESGPSLRASYRPNDPSNPFTVSIKTGIGSFGSPAGAPMSMTAEFNVIGGNSNPSFSVLFKPRFGDFSFKKSVGSAVILPPEKNIADMETDASAVWVETPGLKKVNGMGAAGLGRGISDLLTGVEVSAKSVLPLKSKAAVRFRWGVRVPPELRTALAEDRNRALSLGKLPLLVMSKISIEYLAEDKRKVKGDDVSKGANDVAEACMSVRKQLEAIQAENGMLRKAVDEIRGSIPVTPAGGQVSAAPPREADVSSKGVRREVRHLEGSGRPAPATGPKKEEMTEELKKALMGAAGGGK